LDTPGYETYGGGLTDSTTTQILFLRASVFFRNELWKSTPKDMDEVKGNFDHDLYRAVTFQCQVHATSGSQRRSIVHVVHKSEQCSVPWETYLVTFAQFLL